MEVLRQAKKRKEESMSSVDTGDPQSSAAETIPTFSDYDSEEDSTFDPEEEDFDEEVSIHTYSQEWVESLDRDDLLSLSILLWYLLVNVLQFQLTEAAKLIGNVIGKSDRTVREWRATFIANEGEFPDTMQGKYQREGVLWHNEELNKIATRYIRENTCVKGRPNMTASSFCKWVNEILLPNHVLTPGYPRHIAIETGRKWLHELGFQILDHKKGTYVDGHERPDVVEYRQSFLRRMFSLGFLNKDNALTPEAEKCFPQDLESPSAEQISKTVVIFHDESTFQANDGQTSFWGTKDMHLLRPKGRGAGIMVSDFIEDHNGYLRLTDEEFARGLQKYPYLKRQARSFLEYGENKEGYWTSDKFLAQIKEAVQIVDVKYPREKGYRIVWIFDHSSCHGAYAEDALNAHKMNAKPGGKQPRMRNTVWQGKVQTMVFSIGVPKGLIQVLKERGVDTRHMKLEDMRRELASHSDFREEKTKIEHFLNNCGYTCIMLPKFHCELNPIERCWAQAKRYARAFTNYTIGGLRQIVPDALESVTLENIRKHFRKVRQYMYGYLQGIAAGPELETFVKKRKKIYTSHRRIEVNE